MIERWFEPFTLLEKTVTPDGLGSTELSCIPGTAFRGAVSFTAGEERTMAGQLLLRENPVLLHEFDVTLVPGDLVCRDTNGVVYRVLGRSDTLRSPVFSGLQFAQVPVERVVFPC